MYIMHLKHQLPNYIRFSGLGSEDNCMQYAGKPYRTRYKFGFIV